MTAIKSLVFLGAVCISASAMALPPEWDPFMICTKVFTPHSAPSGHFETTVANRVTTDCFKLAPPGLPNSGEFGPIGPAPDTRDPADVPCQRIPDAIAKLAKHRSELDAQIKSLDASIAAGHASLDVLGRTAISLSGQCAADRRSCNTQQAVYMNKLRQKIATLRSFCSHIGLAEERMDCMEDLSAEAEIAPSVAAARAQRDTKCDLLSAGDGACMRSADSAEVARQLTQELQSWNQQRKALAIARAKDVIKINALREKQKSPECKAW